MSYMQRTGLIAFLILAIIISCISCVYAQSVPVVPSPVKDQNAGTMYPDVAMGSDYKWSHAQSHTQVELAASGIQITDSDIAYARMEVASAVKDCSNMGGVWCTYANDDRNALQEMINVQAQQENNPSPVAVDTARSRISRISSTRPIPSWYSYGLTSDPR